MSYQQTQGHSPDQGGGGGGRYFFSRLSSRRGTQHSEHSRRTMSFPKMAEEAREAKKPERYPEQVSAYTGLTWETLHEFLSNKWPEETFEKMIRDDYFCFDTPQPLNKVRHDSELCIL
jgi:hypothetical protein